MKTIFVDAHGKSPEAALNEARSKMVNDIMDINGKVDSAFTYGITSVSHSVARTASAKVDEKYYASIFASLEQ